MKKNRIIITVSLVFCLVGCALSNGSSSANRKNKKEDYVKFPDYNVDALKGKMIFENEDLSITFIDYVTVDRQDTFYWYAEHGNYAAAYIELEANITSSDGLSFRNSELSFNGMIPIQSDAHGTFMSSNGDLHSMIDRLDLDDLSYLDSITDQNSYDIVMREGFASANDYLTSCYQGKYRILIVSEQTTRGTPHDVTSAHRDYVRNHLHNYINIGDKNVTRISGYLEYEKGYNSRRADIDFSTEENPARFGLLEGDEVLKVYSDDNLDVYCLFPKMTHYYTEWNSEKTERIILQYSLVLDTKNDLIEGAEIMSKDDDYPCEFTIEALGNVKKMDGVEDYIYLKNTTSKIVQVGESFPGVCHKSENGNFVNAAENESIEDYDAFASELEIRMKKADSKSSDYYTVYTEPLKLSQFEELVFEPAKEKE